MCLWKAIVVSMILCGLAACIDQPDPQTKEQNYLQEQEQKQGYPTLIAIPIAADYALPFCEKKYCIDIEVFSFNSQDQWFNDYTNQKIAELIRQQLGLAQKLSLQRAVNEFIAQSDLWQQENKAHKPWVMYVSPRVAMQQGALALLVMNTEYQMGDKKVPAQNHFYVVDRKVQKTIRLYDVIKENQRIPLMDEIQSHYQIWQKQLTEEQKLNLPEKLFWANQDWFFDEHGIALYYRAKDLAVDGTKDLTIYLTPEQSADWIKDEYIQQLNLR